MSATHNARVGVVVALAGLLAGGGRALAADNAQYHFKVGDQIIYRVIVKAQKPGEETTQTGYLVYVPKSSDPALGQATLTYNWAVYHGTTTRNGVTFGGVPRVPSFLAKGAATNPTNPTGPEIVVGARGEIVTFTGNSEQAQLEHALGPAWRVMLLPLPPEGKTTWTDQHKINVRYFTLPKGPGGFPIDQRQTVQTVPADETLTYTAKPPVDGQTVIGEKYELKISEGGVSEQTTGEGEYCFDGKAGFVKTLHMKFATLHKQNDVSVTTACTLDGTLVTADDLAKLQAEAAVAKAAEDKIKEAEEKKRAEQTDKVPDGMEQSELVGNERGGTFAKVSAKNLPVIGFYIETGDWFGHKAFRSFDPVFDPKAQAGPRQTLVLAREGYAVGAITVNANKDSVCAICVTFMKKTDKGLDPKDKYVSPWYGQKQGESQKVISGKGRFVYGIAGRKGLNIDAIGIVTEAAPGDDTDK